MPRALSRLALNRGRPARPPVPLAADCRPPPPWRRCSTARGRPPRSPGRSRRWTRFRGSSARRMTAALADDVPLLKRDGNFVRPGYHAELDEMRALRDQSRRVIAGLQMQLRRGDRRPLAQDQAQQRARLFHRGERRKRLGPDRHGRGEGALHPSPDHGERHALHDDGARRSGDEDRQRRRPGARRRTRRSSTNSSPRWSPKRTRSGRAARALAVLDVSCGLALLAESEGYCRPDVDGSTAFEIVAGRHPVVEQALRRQAAIPSSPTTATCRPPARTSPARSGCSPAPTWAASRRSSGRTR